MVVDDEPIIRMDLCEILYAEGYEVVAAVKNGEKAVEMAYQYRPDLILMDVTVSKMNGVKAAKIISSFSEAMIVLLTANSPKSIIKDIKEAGAIAYLMKPITVENLIPAIEIALGQKARLSQLHSQIRELQQEMETRKKVEKAKGKVMERSDMKEEEAFRWLQKESMQSRLPLGKVAQSVLLGEK